MESARPTPNELIVSFGVEPCPEQAVTLMGVTARSVWKPYANLSNGERVPLTDAETWLREHGYTHVAGTRGLYRRVPTRTPK